MSFHKLPDVTDKIMKSAVANSKGKLGSDKETQDKLRKKIDNARKKAQQTLDDKHQKRAKRKGGCNSCAAIKNPCKDLAGGNPENDGKKYRGGGHGKTKKRRPTDKKGEFESHHMPADDAYPESHAVKRDRMPAIRMKTGDHKKTASHGHQGREARKYRKKQTRKIKAGKHSEAFGMDVADLKDRHDGKYDDAIAEAAAYAACLEMQGEI